MNLLELLYESVATFADKECLRFKREGRYKSLTYLEFWNAVHEFAIGLKVAGVKAGDKIGILSANCPQWAISDYAIMLLGAVVVPIYATLPSQQIEFILQNAEVSWLLVENHDQLQKVKQNWLPGLNHFVQFFGETPVSDETVSSFADICATGKQQRPTWGELDFHAPLPEQIATIVHTSGTSGTPKGVMLSHENLVFNIKSSLTYLPVKPEDVALSFLPLSHIFERAVGQFALLSSGTAIAYAESIDTIQQNLKEVKPTVLCTVPRLLEKVYAKILEQTGNLPRFLQNVRAVDWMVQRKLRKGFGGRVRCIVSGGAGLAADIAEFFNRANLPVHEGYGMTEAAPVICVNPLRQSRAGTVGRPIPGVKVRVEEDGELLVKGANVMLGYYRNPEETAKAITEDGWLRTGDMASIEDGYVKIVDRKKNILVLATGKNVAPWPIENSISLSPYIAQAILIGDKRNYATCLLVPDFEVLAPIAKEKHLGSIHEDWLKHPQISEKIRQEVIRTTQDFADFERPKRAILLPCELSMEDGELTPTLKVRNAILLKKYGDRIEAMYNGSGYLPIFENGASDKTDNSRAESSAVPEASKLSPVWLYAAAGILLGLTVRWWIGG